MRKVAEKIARPLLGVALGLGLGTAWAAEGPVAVSPGAAATMARIEDRCPAFSWGAVPGATRFELVVVRVREGGAEPEPVLREILPGSASSWTPSLERCLERGVRYGWSLRALGESTASEWSAPRLFEVVPGPSRALLEEALRVVREPLGATGRAASGAASGPADSPPPAAGQVVSSGASAPLQPPAMGTLLSVDGNLDAVSFTGSGANLTGVATDEQAVGTALCPTAIPTEGRRYLDLGDGTVLDCKTKLLWLKTSNCFGLRAWADAQSDAAGLASGSCGLTDGSAAGEWRLPTISEYCAAGAIEGVCPPGDAPTSLIDSSVSGSPKVVSEIGDGPWSEGDAFLGITYLGYWSGTEDGPTSAWWAGVWDGSIHSSVKSAIAIVWPVRGGP